MNKLVSLNKAFKGGEILINKDAIASVELCDSGCLNILLVNGRNYLINDFCIEENPMMAFLSYVEQGEEK